MIRTDGMTWPWPRNRYLRKTFRLVFRVREWLVPRVEVGDGATRCRFRCGSFREFSRSMKLFIKEPGTCDWLKQVIQPGDVFYDIGANIGVYSLLAARYTGTTGRVYAFEPHSANFSALLENIRVNRDEAVVIPCNFALHDEAGFFPFNYFSGQPGSAESQLASTRDAFQKEFRPRISELKYAVSIDSLVDGDAILPPQHIKIDVDGNELKILRGMTRLLKGSGRPRSVQVEINRPCKDGVFAFMAEHDYVLAARHFTRYGQELVSRGGNPEDHSYNAIFEYSP